MVKSFRIKVLLASDLTLKRHSLNNVALCFCVAGMVNFIVKGYRGTVVKFLTLTAFVLHFVNDILGVIMTGTAASTRLCE